MKIFSCNKRLSKHLQPREFRREIPDLDHYFALLCQEHCANSLLMLLQHWISTSQCREVACKDWGKCASSRPGCGLQGSILASTTVEDHFWGPTAPAACVDQLRFNDVSHVMEVPASSLSGCTEFPAWYFFTIIAQLWFEDVKLAKTKYFQSEKKFVASGRQQGQGGFYHLQRETTRTGWSVNTWSRCC